MELTTSEAARLYGVFPSALHRLILMGKLAARKDPNGRWLISKESLECWNAQRVRRVRCGEPMAPRLRPLFRAKHG